MAQTWSVAPCLVAPSSIRSSAIASIRAHDVVRHVLLKSGDIYISDQNGRLLVIAHNVIGSESRALVREQLVLAQAQGVEAQRQLQHCGTRSEQCAG